MYILQKNYMIQSIFMVSYQTEIQDCSNISV